MTDKGIAKKKLCKKTKQKKKQTFATRASNCLNLVFLFKTFAVCAHKCCHLKRRAGQCWVQLAYINSAAFMHSDYLFLP